jgi:predicted RNA-binding Zn ribbon-like protein
VIFAHDTEVALAAAAALVNTGLNDGDQLDSPPALEAFARRWQWSGVGELGRTDVEQVDRLRPVLHGLWHTDTDTAVAVVNDLLARAHALPQLVKHDQWDYHLHATSAAAPLAERMAVEAAMAMVDVIRTQQLDRLRTCDGKDCQDVYVDLSKNSSRRFCSGSCGNRASVAAYRARRR